MFSGLPRQSGMRVYRGLEHGVDDLLGRIVGVDRDHLGAVDHDVGDGEVAQVEQAAEHVAVVLLDAAFAVQEIDGAAQLLVRREDRCVVPDPKPNRRRIQRTSHSIADQQRRRAAARSRRSAAQPAAPCGRGR